jgi:drug/metabolite transporter (DMT)-like permease
MYPVQCVLIGSMNWLSREKTRVAPLAGLLVLCFLWSLGSLRIDLFPSMNPDSLPQMVKDALPFAWLAAAAALIAVVRRAKWPHGRQIWIAVFIGLGLFVVPSWLVQLSGPWVPEFTRVALFSLVPVFAVVFEPYIGGVTGLHHRGDLIAALAAVGGTLCFFPADIPNSIEAGFAFCAVVLAAACIAATNCIAVKVANQLPARSVAPMAAIAGATAAVGFATSAAVESFAESGALAEQALWKWDSLAPELAWSAAIGLPGLLLLFWLMRRISAVRMTTRFVLAPVFAALFGLFFLQPVMGLRIWLELLLVAAGVGWLLFAPEEEADGASLPLKLNRE